MERPQLNDPAVYPTRDVLHYFLCEAYPVLKSLMSTITAEEARLVPEWRFYHDGKAWLCNVQLLMPVNSPSWTICCVWWNTRKS